MLDSALPHATFSQGLKRSYDNLKAE